MGREAWQPNGHAAISVRARIVSSRMSSGMAWPAAMRRPLYFLTSSGSALSCIDVVVGGSISIGVVSVVVSVSPAASASSAFFSLGSGDLARS